jgi:hypothetical protein
MKCGQRLPLEAEFCSRCGKKVDEKYEISREESEPDHNEDTFHKTMDDVLNDLDSAAADYFALGDYSIELDIMDRENKTDTDIITLDDQARVGQSTQVDIFKGEYYIEVGEIKKGKKSKIIISLRGFHGGVQHIDIRQHIYDSKELKYIPTSYRIKIEITKAFDLIEIIEKAIDAFKEHNQPE